MSGPNLTGLPNTDDYLLGRGRVYLSLLDANTGLPVGGYRDIGNAPDMKISVAVQTLDHDSSRHGLKITDKSVTISQKATVSFSADEINHENFRAFVAGSEATPTNASVAGWTNATLTLAANLALGRWYDLANLTAVRAYDVKQAKLSLIGTDNSPLTFGTDYTLDLEMGRVFVLSTSTNAATLISGTKGIKTTYVADATAHGVDEVDAMTGAPVTCALKFIGENAANDDRQYELQVGQIQLNANGDLSLIGDQFSTLGFTGACEQDVNGNTLTLRTIRSV